MILLQNPNIPVATNPVEIDAAIIDILSELNSNLSWLDNGYGRAYKNADAKNGGVLFFPEVYLGTQNNSQRYLNVTPDNDKGGSCFFYVSRETITQFQTGMYGFLNYQMAIIFSCNMELIQSTLLSTDYFQQNLIAEVRNVLSRLLLGKNYQLTLQSVEYLIENVFAEFDIQDTNQVEKAPFTHFRVNCTLVVPEQCPVPEIIPTVVCKSMDLDGVNEYMAYGVYPNPFTGNDAFNFEYTDSFTLSLWVKFDTIGISQPLINKYNNTAVKGYYFLINNLNQIRFGIQSQGGQTFQIRTTDTITSGVFYHIVATYDGSNTIGGLNIYINGNLANFNQIFNLPLISTLIDANQPLEIGRLGTNFGYLNGLISSVRIWNTELSAGEVATEYNSGVINPSPVQSGSLVLDADIPNATFLTADPTYGTGYLINNKVDDSKFFTYNSEIEDLVDGCPE
jgi:hypothetical protein